MTTKIIKYSKVLLSLLFLFKVLIGYSAEKDSLIQLINSRKINDTTQIINIRALAYYYLLEEGDKDKAIETTNKAIRIAEKINSIKWSAKTHSLMGFLKQNYTTDFEGAIKSYFVALKYFEKENNELDKYTVLLNLGTLYYQYNQLDDAEKYFKVAEKIALKLNRKDDLATIHFNLGSTYDVKGQVNLANQYYEKARAYYLEIGSELDLATIDFNIANTSLNSSKEFIDNVTRLKAVGVYKRVITVFKKYEADNYYITAIIALGVQLTEVGNLKEATNYLLEAEEFAASENNYTLLIEIYSKLADNYNKRGEYMHESAYLRKLTSAKDSLFVENKSKAIAEVQIQYQTEKVETENEVLYQQSQIKDLEISKRDIELTQSKTIRIALFGGVLILLVFGGFTYKRYKESQAQKKIIEEQKEVVEIKSKEITDSINYAKRIQTAILPSSVEMNHHLKDGFVLYLPKDIVAGDFYWMEVVEDSVLFAVADCTGHGVPGAMVSVVCNSALNRAVGEFNLVEPAKILDKVRELVIETFEQSGDDIEVKDGMDISLVRLNKKTIEIEWAGANNPLWIARKGNSELIEYKPNKQPIGKHFKQEPFKNHKIELQKNDVIYMFTDGYADQFGGEKGKKLMYKTFKELLLTIQNKSMDEQKTELEQYFINWKGSLEQVDDVCIIGVRIA